MVVLLHLDCLILYMKCSGETAHSLCLKSMAKKRLSMKSQALRAAFQQMLRVKSKGWLKFGKHFSRNIKQVRKLLFFSNSEEQLPNINAQVALRRTIVPVFTLSHSDDEWLEYRGFDMCVFEFLSKMACANPSERPCIIFWRSSCKRLLIYLKKYSKTHLIFVNQVTSLMTLMSLKRAISW